MSAGDPAITSVSETALPTRPRWRVARGARAAEAAVLGEIETLLAEDGPGALARPVRVIVPSNSLRRHLAAELVRRRGRAALGVVVQTLYGAALEVLERGGERAPRGRLLFDVLARRLAGDEPELAAALEPLVDGYGAVAATVRDLLDAGLTPEHAEAAEEALATDGPAVASDPEVDRARALVRVAAGLARGAEALGIGRISELLARAAARLAADPGTLPARAVIVHGYADATGVALDLLEALLRHPRALLVIDHPPDPAVPRVGDGAAGGGLERGAAGTGAGAAGGDGQPPAPAAARDAVADGEPGPPYTQRLRDRLAPVFGGAVEPEPFPGDGGPPPRLAAFRATTADGEARELAVRARRLIDSGVRPEAIGLVVRDAELYRLPLRRHLRLLGVPFSGAGALGSLGPPARRARALIELLRRGGDLPADRWLDAAERLGPRRLPPRHRVDLRLAFFALGAGRLSDVGGLDVERYLQNGAYPLPVRQGLRPVRETDEEEAPDAEETRDRREEAAGTVALRRRVPGERLRAAADAAAALAGRIEAWPKNAPAADHFRHLEGLCREGLGWRLRERAGGPEPAAAEVLRGIAGAEGEVPPRLVLTFDELRLLLTRALERVGWAPLGGEGGGVQVLGATEARGRTFEHLLVAGLSRGVFPRTVRPDPLLSDPLRRVLARVLPEVPVKQRGFDEERYLFAQLVSAAPEVTLSWPAEGTDGRPVPPSPLVERLLPRTGLEVPKAPSLWALGGARESGGEGAAGAAGEGAGEAALRPAREHAVLAALHGPRAAFRAVLPAAVAEARRALRLSAAPRPDLDLAAGPDPDGRAVAAARLGVLDEIDPDLSTPEGRATRARLGPYLGFVGGLGAAPADDPRRRDLFVTALERMAACPWQVFLERVLRVEPTPDPVLSLPDVDPLLLGNAVHRVLERLVLDALGEDAPATLEEAAARPPAHVAWPPNDELERLLRRETAELVVEEGVALAGMARALEVRAGPYLAEAAGSDWRAGSVPAAGAEVRGEVAIEDASGRTRPLGFKADRADVRPGGLALTDYKTGRPLSTAKTETYRRRHLLAEIAAGKRLQAVAYALAGGAATGRYLFLKPELPEETREFPVAAGDAEAVAAFLGAVRAALAAWDEGAFFPRVVLPDENKEPPTCRWCSVAQACLRGDSGARLRIFEWAGRRHEGGEPGGDSNGHPAPPPADPGETAVLGVWDLLRKPDRPGKGR